MTDRLKVGGVDARLESTPMVKFACIVAGGDSISHAVRPVASAFPVDLPVPELVAGADPLPATVVADDVLPAQTLLERFVQEWTDASRVAVPPLALVVRAAIAIGE